MYIKLAAAMSGILFGLGLAISQMINPDKVISFLDITGDWDPSLALVLFAAVSATAVGFAFANKRSQPLFADAFHLPTRSDLDPGLVLGAAIFGIGWGLVGYCPGPAIAASTSGAMQPLLFVGAMLVGSCLASRISL
ncbi:MAG: putative membrane protein YedE/YeeE [Halioglobus sp.]|jgi:uncharacterized membrane protein YedE/YeeE